MTRAIQENANQYCRSGGENMLVSSLAKHYSPLVGRDIDPLTEVTITGDGRLRFLLGIFLRPPHPFIILIYM